LVVAPTRELAQQIEAEAAPFARVCEKKLQVLERKPLEFCFLFFSRLTSQQQPASLVAKEPVTNKSVLSAVVQAS